MRQFLPIYLLLMLATPAIAQKMLLIAHHRWPAHQKIFVGQTIHYKVDEHWYVRKVVDLNAEAQTIEFSDGAVIPLEYISAIVAQKHIQWGLFPRVRRWLATYSGNPMMLNYDPSQPNTQFFSFNLLAIGGEIVTGPVIMPIGRRYRLHIVDFSPGKPLA
jgi:hypothetical protein